MKDRNSNLEKVQAVFGTRAKHYTTSDVHADEKALQEIIDLVEPEADWSCLDVATGSGHAAFALSPLVKSIIGIDITVEMLDEALKLKEKHGMDNVSFSKMDIHDLAFPSESFDLVTCRRAAHHFYQIGRALSEMHRVIVLGGKLVIDDRIVPKMQSLGKKFNLLDLYHDSSHVEEYSSQKWIDLLEGAGFKVLGCHPYVKMRPVTSLTKGVEPGKVSKIHGILQSMSEVERDEIHLQEINGIIHFNHYYVTVIAEKKKRVGN